MAIQKTQVLSPMHSARPDSTQLNQFWKCSELGDWRKTVWCQLSWVESGRDVIQSESGALNYIPTRSELQLPVELSWVESDRALWIGLKGSRNYGTPCIMFEGTLNFRLSSFRRGIINTAMDQWRKYLHVCVRAIGGHYEHLLWTNSCKQFAFLCVFGLSLIHIWRCRRSTLCRSRWSPYH